MTLPALITVTGTIRDESGPVAGRFTFTRSAVLFPASSSDVNLVVPKTVEANVGADGLLSVGLYASNDPAASPTGWTWEVRPQFPNWKTPFSIVVPFDAADGTVKLNQLAPVPNDEDGDLYALVNHTHAGGGSISYGSVTAQTSYGAASNSGSSDSVSRSDHRHGTPALPSPADIGAATSGHNHTGTYDPSGTASSAVAAHVAAGDPHSQYLTATEGNAAYDALGASTSAVSTHVAASDPHTQYSRINYWDGSAYVVVTGAEIYVGGTGPVSPTNGDVHFP